MLLCDCEQGLQNHRTIHAQEDKVIAPAVISICSVRALTVQVEALAVTV